MKENWSPKKGEKIRVSQAPLTNGNKGVIATFNTMSTAGYFLDKDLSVWKYAKPFSEAVDYIPLDEQLEIQNKMIDQLKNEQYTFTEYPKFGILYEFYDDDKHSEELIFIGQGAGKYFGISQDDYDEITKGWEGTVHAYNNVREIKVYPQITPEQIAEKFDVPVTKLVIEGFHKITDEEKKEAIEAHIFNFKQRPMKEGGMNRPTRKVVIVEGDGLLDKEMD